MLSFWVFRNFVNSDKNGSNASRDQQGRRRQNWQRDFENKNDTGYHNTDRNFEEVDEEEDKDDDEFNDF